MNNIMFCSCGRRAQLFRYLKESLQDTCQIIATDNSNIAPALYLADRQYLVPRIDDPNYVQAVLDVFEKEGILVLAPSKETARHCFDKYDMFQYLHQNNIRTVLTYDSLEHFNEGYAKGEIRFPVFIKPRTGSGSVGIHKCDTREELEAYFREGEFDYIIQEFMDGGDCDADVYIDCFSHQPVAAFSKRKLETKIGGANKTISFKDPKLFAFIKEICKVLEFNGPVDMDFWYKDGEYYLSEVNPRFGGAYLHAYGAGVDFFKLIQRNMEGKTNEEQFGNYDDDVLMMMYDSVVIVKKDELAK